jgi:hypothetical protein
MLLGRAPERHRRRISSHSPASLQPGRRWGRDRRRDATGRNTDIVTVARGAGIENSRWVRDQAHFDELMDRRFDGGGPVFIAAKIDNQPGIGQPVRDPALIRHRFMQGLGSGRRSALDD